MSGGRLLVDEPADGVVRLTISNPAKRNALDHAILDGIAETVPRLEDDVRCLLITADGPVFSAGYDIGNLPRDEFAQKAEQLVAHPFTGALEALDACDVPTLAALPGHTIGGGLELALACDVRLAADGIHLGMPPAKLGLVYSHTGLRRFIEAIGVPRTRELFLLGRNVDAPTAERWGLVSRVADSDEVQDVAVDLARELAANAPLSVQGNKQVLRALVAADVRLDEQVQRELIALREACFQSEDMREGVRAFAEKRPPRWQGR